MGGGQDKLAWTACPPSQQLSIQNNATEKTVELTWIMFIIDTSSQSNSFKKGELAIKFYFDTQMSGGQDKLAWTAYRLPLQLSIQNNPTKKTAEFDLNYVNNWYIFTIK